MSGPGFDPTVPAAPAETGDADQDIERARVRAQVRRGLFGGPPNPVRLEGFEILGRLGAGAMGVVYEARDPQLDRVVALKLLHPDTAEHTVGTRTELLLEEARAMARVRHPNIVTVHQVGTHGEQVYVAMERVKETLRAWLERTRPSSDRRLEVLLAAGRGLAAAHREGLVHRDFKLDNVLMHDDGQPRVSDFGLALRAPSERERAGSSSPARFALAGTPAYMSPEQLRGEAVDARSDQWSFCVTAIEALTGKRPFPANDANELLEALLGGPSADDLRGLQPAVASVLRRGLEPEPSARFPSMDALLERLDMARQGPRRRWPVVAVVAGVSLVAAAALLAAYLTRGKRDSVAPSAPPAALVPPSASAASTATADITRLCTAGFFASSESASHPAAHAFDGSPGTAWTEGTPGDGIGEWLEAKLRPGTWVTSVEVAGGWSFETASGVDLWQHNNTFRKMRVSWDGGEAIVEFARSKDRGQRKRVDVGASTSAIRITALEVDRGRFRELCLDEVVIRGSCPPQGEP